MNRILRTLSQRLGFDFTDSDLVRRALAHRSSGSDNNERMEFLGDSILNFIVAEALWRRFPEAHEGELSRMRAQLVKGQTLAELARRFELGDLLILGAGELKSGGNRRESILADTLEALVAAIYLQGGLDACRDCVVGWFEEQLATITPEQTKDAKTQLQEWLQARKTPVPDYRIENAIGEDHQQHFIVACFIQGVDERFLGEGSSRRNAEQAAAEKALIYLQSRP